MNGVDSYSLCSKLQIVKHKLLQFLHNHYFVVIIKEFIFTVHAYIIMVVSLNYHILLFGNKTIVKLYVDFYSLLLLPLWKLLIVKGTYPVTA